MTKRMLLAGIVVMGLAVQGVLGQDGPTQQLDAQEIAQLEQIGVTLFAQNAQTKALNVQAQAQDAQAQAQKVQTLVKIAQDQMKQHLEPGTYLGIASTAVSAELREQLKLKHGVGLVVQRVEKGSPAEQAGVKQYDIVEKLDDQVLVNAEQFAALVRMQEPGKQVTLSIIRQGQPQTITATLIEKQIAPSVFLWNDFNGNMTIKAPNLQDFKFDGPIDPVTRTPRNMTITSSVSGKVLTITRDGDNTHLYAKDQAGTELFDGDVNTDEQWKQVPPDVATEAARLMNKMKLDDKSTFLKALNAETPKDGSKLMRPLREPTPVKPAAPPLP